MSPPRKRGVTAIYETGSRSHPDTTSEIFGIFPGVRLGHGDSPPQGVGGPAAEDPPILVAGQTPPTICFASREPNRNLGGSLSRSLLDWYQVQACTWYRLRRMKTTPRSRCESPMLRFASQTKQNLGDETVCSPHRPIRPLGNPPILGGGHGIASKNCW